MLRFNSIGMFLLATDSCEHQRAELRSRAFERDIPSSLFFNAISLYCDKILCFMLLVIFYICFESFFAIFWPSI